MAFPNLPFPPGFLWGSAASAHQTEGGNHNDWSEWERIPGKIKDGTTSSIACDHYNRYEEDFDLAQSLGHQVHRFSVEWSRIEPARGHWEDHQLDHYRKVVEALIARGIQPMVTLHHFTNPLWFRDLDAWLNPESPELFAPYCRKVAEALCDYDIIWNTINEPMVVSVVGYLFGEFPPGLQDYGKTLTVAKHLLMAHGQAATQIREVYEERGLEQPQIAPVISASYFMPADSSNEEDVELAQYYNELYNHVWINGAVRGVLPEPLGDGSRYAPLERSTDFIGLNYYSRVLVSSKIDFLAGEEPPKDPHLERCEGLDWEVYPEGYYHVMKDMWTRYKTPIFLTENGIGTSDDSLRCRYILRHLQQVHRAINEGIDVRGYLVWSLTDNFEWAHGYSSHFGLVEVDYKTLERRPRESAYMFQKIIQDNGVSSELQMQYLAPDQ
ncbi:MAG: glycoside hydrolase family 1 protein [Candidatus Thorarchaeota archaeon]|nr:glycoside hydrolase family 1 protein [Candidatus Thorarchaeota archaeon]